MKQGFVVLAAGVLLLVLAVYASSALVHLAAVVVLVCGAIWTGIALARQEDAARRVAQALGTCIHWIAIAFVVGVMVPVLVALLYALWSAILSESASAYSLAVGAVLFAAAACAAVVALGVLRGKRQRPATERAA